MLTADGVLPIALGDNWIYALVPPPDERDDGVLLIDAGPDYEGAWEILDAQLQAAGYSVADVRCVAITHAHLDHCGLAPRWQREGARIAGAAAELERFAQGENVSRYQAPEVLRFLTACGVPAQRLEPFQAARRTASLRQPDRAVGAPPWPGPLRASPFQPDQLLAGGDSVRVGTRTVTFIACPGHTPGNGVFFDASTHALFSGDQVLPHLTPNPGIHFENGERLRSLPNFSRSLLTLESLDPRHLYPGHGEHTPNAGGAIDRTARHHRRRQDRLRRFLRDGPLTPYEALQKFFPHLPDARLWQAMAEVVGHLDALLERGDAVEKRGADGNWRVGPA